MIENQIYVSVLLPAFAVRTMEEIVYHKIDIKPIILREQLKIPFESFDIISLPALCDTQREYCVRLNQFEFTLHDLERLLLENKSLQNQLEKCKDSMMTLSKEFNFVLNNPSVPQEVDKQKQIKQTKKIKTLKEENKKLRLLLKAQLENSEKMRIETQTTVETLREEFDLLVNELSNLQKKEQILPPEIKSNTTRQTQRPNEIVYDEQHK